LELAIGNPVAVITDRFGRATVQGLASLPPFLGCLGLMEDNAEAEFVVTPERGGRGIEADNFDFIVNLISLGLGVSLVPHRVLALHPKTRPVTRLRTEPRFSLELVVMVRREATHAPILSGFLENVLF
jgi:DNA-binding transcriptional LysR family regulator